MKGRDGERKKEGSEREMKDGKGRRKGWEGREGGRGMEGRRVRMRWCRKEGGREGWRKGKRECRVSFRVLQT